MAQSTEMPRHPSLDRLPTRPARAWMRGVALMSVLLLCAGCGGATDEAPPADEGRRAADDATAEALRNIAAATNEALAGAESVPAPVNALAIEDSAAETSEGAAPSAPRYEVTGASSEPEAVVAAEEGRLGRAALVWFHAEWCHVCQEIAPDMATIREDYGTDIAFVKVDIDDPEADTVERRFNVRGTPTFVLFDAEGRTAGHLPGWPGPDRMTAYLDQLQ